MTFNRGRLLGSLLIAALIGCVATLLSAAESRTNVEILRELIDRAEATTKRSTESAATAERLVTEGKRLSAEWRRRDEELPFSTHDQFFVVGALGRSFSESVLKAADDLRKDQQIRLTLIRVELDDDPDEEDVVVTLGRRNQVWITAATKERVFELLPKAIEVIARNGATDEK